MANWITDASVVTPETKLDKPGSTPPVNTAITIVAADMNGASQRDLDTRAYIRGQRFDVKLYGAVGDGLTNDTVAIQAAIDAAEAAGGGTVFFPHGVYSILSAELTVQAPYVTLLGETGSIIRAAVTATFEALLRTNASADYLRIANLEWDANGFLRAGVLPQRAINAYVIGGTDIDIVDCVFRNALGDPLSSVPGVNLGVSGVTRAKISRCSFLDGGVAGNASDGVYAKGDQIIISDCIAINCIDTAFVLENCNSSGIVGCVSVGSSVGAAITVGGVTSLTYSDNFIDGLTVKDWSAATGGVAIGVPSAATAGILKNTRVSGLNMQVAAGGVGPAVQVSNASSSGGLVQRVLFEGMLIDGAGSHCVNVQDGSSDIIITASHFRKYDTLGSPINIRTGNSNITISNCTTYGGLFGIASTDPNQVNISGCYIDGNTQATYGIYFFGTQVGTLSARVTNCSVFRITTSRYGSDAGVTPMAVNLDTSRTESGLIFGHAQDTNLYRSAAATLRTTSSLVVGKSLMGARTTPTYGTSVAIDSSLGNEFVITPTDGAAFTVANPSAAIAAGQRFTVRIVNTFGVLGALSWGANYRTTAGWTQPANGFSRAIEFQYNGSVWVELFRSAADIAN